MIKSIVFAVVFVVLGAVGWIMFGDQITDRFQDKQAQVQIEIQNMLRDMPQENSEHLTPPRQ